MNNLYLNILGFLACAAFIIYSGAKLSFYGDKIADPAAGESGQDSLASSDLLRWNTFRQWKHL